MSEEGKLPTSEEVISMCPGPSREALGNADCYAIIKLPKTKKEKAVIDMTNHA